MIGNWNVRTIYATGAAAQVAKETRQYKIDILGISECRWTGAGRTRLTTGETVLHAGEEDVHQRGLALRKEESKRGEKNWGEELELDGTSQAYWKT